MGTAITHIPYKGTGPAMQDLVGSRIDFLCDIVATAKPQIDGGSVKGIAIMTKDRSPVLPNLKSAQEQGLAGFEAYIWSGIFLPRARPPRSSKSSMTRSLRPWTRPWSASA